MKKIYFSVLLMIAALAAESQFINNTSVNTMVANLDASDIQTASTNDGRTWIAFYSQNGSNYDMRAQLLSVTGQRKFGDSAILVSTKKSGSATFVFNVCVDKDNNFIIAYQVLKGSSYECVIQKISTEGNLLWGKNGVDLGGGLSPYPVTLSTDEIAVAWNDNNNKIEYQKLSTDGVAAWSTPKVFSGTGTHAVTRAQLVAGTWGRFGMVYQDQFSFPFYTHLFAQRFDNDGNPLWANAVQVSTLTTASYRYFDVHSDNDTIYIGYYGNPSGSNRFDAYVQRVNDDGSLPFGADGASFAPGFSGSNDPYPQTIYIAKQHGNNDVWAVSTVTNSLQSESGVYVQKFDATTGSLAFGNTAKMVLPINAKLNSLAFSQLSLCGNNPVFLVTSNNNRLAAIKLNDNGSFAWTNKTVVIGGSPNTKFRYGFTNFYKGQAVAVWQEDKGTGNRPFAQNIRCDGRTGHIKKPSNNNDMILGISIKNIYPNPVVNNLTATIISSTQSRVHIYITDVSGNILMQNEQNLQNGNNTIQLNVSNIKPGSYFIKIIGEKGSASAMFNK